MNSVAVDAYVGAIEEHAGGDQCAQTEGDDDELPARTQDVQKLTQIHGIPSGRCPASRMAVG